MNKIKLLYDVMKIVKTKEALAGVLQKLEKIVSSGVGLQPDWLLIWQGEIYAS